MLVSETPIGQQQAETFLAIGWLLLVVVSLWTRTRSQNYKGSLRKVGPPTNGVRFGVPLRINLYCLKFHQVLNCGKVSRKNFLPNLNLPYSSYYVRFKWHLLRGRWVKNISLTSLGRRPRGIVPCIVSVLLSLARRWQVCAGRGGAESVAHHSLRHTTARLWINHKPLWAKHAIYHGMLTSSSTLTDVWNANVKVTTLNGTDCFLILQTHCGKTLPAAVVAGGDRSKPVVQNCLLLSWIGCWTQFW